LTISTFAQDTLSFDSIEYRVKGLGNNPARYFYNNKPFSGIVVKGYRQNPQEIIAVENGKTHGWYKSFHNNGQPKVLEHYEFGRRDGSSQRWYESGQLQYQMTYEQGHLKDTVWGWHENGQLKKMSIEQPFKKYTVESNLWYENGQLQYRATENFQESYHENGKLRVKGTLVKHKCHGKFKYFDENGKVEKIIHWQHGKKKKVITK
jgi:antitoxin component YwqK of YwqJK toxin-antitoxin module